MNEKPLILVLCTGREDVDAWLDALRPLATRELRTSRPRRSRGGGLTGDDSAA